MTPIQCKDWLVLTKLRAFKASSFPHFIVFQFIVLVLTHQPNQNRQLFFSQDVQINQLFATSSRWRPKTRVNIVLAFTSSESKLLNENVAPCPLI